MARLWPDTKECFSPLNEKQEKYLCWSIERENSPASNTTANIGTYFEFPVSINYPSQAVNQSLTSMEQPQENHILLQTLVTLFGLTYSFAFKCFTIIILNIISFVKCNTANFSIHVDWQSLCININMINM